MLKKFHLCGGKTMWSDKKSISLSKFFLVIFMVLLGIVILTAPWLVNQFLYSRAGLLEDRIPFLVTIYIGSIPAATLLVCLFRLLQKIEKGEVFIDLNIDFLRWISWSCFMGAIISLLSTLYYLPWVFVSIAAAFMGLIVRVLKNVIAQAVELKNEADLTI
jgi:hypothetical protein